MNFIVVSNTQKDVGSKLGKLICKQLFELGCGYILLTEKDMSNSLTDRIGVDVSYDYLIIIGGDGSVLRGIYFNNLNLPMLCVNKGTVGFLADLESEDIDVVLHELILNSLETQSYSLLKGITSNSFEDLAFNDIVIGRNGFAHILTTDLYIDNQFVNSFRGDGLLVSTSHGSTAYNLSLRGPMVHPDSDVFIITPIAPQCSQFSSLIVPSTSIIKVVIKDREKGAVITYDGRENKEILCDKSEVIICKSERVVKLVKSKGYNFFDVVRRKL